MRRGRIAGASAVLTLAALIPAVPAAAAVTTADVWVADGWMSVVSSGTTANRIRIEPTADGFALVDDAAPLRLDPARAGLCRQPTNGTIICHTWYGVWAELGAGNDRFDNQRGSNLKVNVWAGDGDDTVLSGLANDVFRGGDGADTIIAGDGIDTIWGENGNDKLYGEYGGDSIFGGPGKDEVWGGDGEDWLVNEDGSPDDLYGGNQNDHLWPGEDVYGGEGDDTIFMTAGLGEYWGEAGYDTIDYSSWPQASLTLSLDGNGNDGGPKWDCDFPINCGDNRYGQHNVHGDFEKVIGSPKDDKISGNGEPDLIEGRGGNDKLYGNGEDDVLDAGPGSNQIANGGAGTDTCRGDNLTRSGCDR
jgi:Ca2+-binding RTX toxin-like protein